MHTVRPRRGECGNRDDERGCEWARRAAAAEEGGDEVGEAQCCGGGGEAEVRVRRGEEGWLLG